MTNKNVNVEVVQKYQKHEYLKSLICLISIGYKLRTILGKYSLNN